MYIGTPPGCDTAFVRANRVFVKNSHDLPFSLSPFLQPSPPPPALHCFTSRIFSYDGQKQQKSSSHRTLQTRRDTTTARPRSSPPPTQEHPAGRSANDQPATKNNGAREHDEARHPDPPTNTCSLLTFRLDDTPMQPRGAAHGYFARPSSVSCCIGPIPPSHLVQASVVRPERQQNAPGPEPDRQTLAPPASAQSAAPPRPSRPLTSSSNTNRPTMNATIKRRMTSNTVARRPKLSTTVTRLDPTTARCQDPITARRQDPTTARRQDLTTARRQDRTTTTKFPARSTANSRRKPPKQQLSRAPSNSSRASRSHCGHNGWTVQRRSFKLQASIAPT